MDKTKEFEAKINKCFNSLEIDNVLNEFGFENIEAKVDILRSKYGFTNILEKNISLEQELENMKEKILQARSYNELYYNA